MRLPLIAGNWKMYKITAEAVEFVQKLKPTLKDIAGMEVVVCPSFVSLESVACELAGSNIALGAQNMYWVEEGAFTGEVSPSMLKAVGCRFVILGHSERRQHFGENDQTVNRKIKAALAAGLIPIVCVGERLEERENGNTEKVVGTQLELSLADLAPKELAGVVIAYEPVWAIGTGRTAETQDAQQVNNYIRSRLAVQAGWEAAEKARILYGGSVKPGNIAGLMSQPDIDGALVGGASLQADTFATIIRNGCKNEG